LKLYKNKVKEEVPILHIFAYQPRSLLKEENKQISQTNLGCKNLTDS